MPLSARPVTTSMISTIHVLKAQAALDDDTYRDFLHQRTGKRSAKDLSVPEASRVIDALREVAGQGPKGAVAGLDTPLGGKLRALWIAGHDLGIVRDRTDRAMLAYLERQTGVSHVRFLKDPRDGTAAIEGLKSWLERAAGVDWPEARRREGDQDVIASKRAVLDAQWRRLIAIGAVKPIGQAVDPMEALQHYAGRIVRHNQWGTMEAHHYDQVQKSLGNKLRGALARRDQAGEPA